MSAELPAGTSLGGKYRIERLLGQGAVGTVYAAEQVETGKRVALKCVDISLTPDPASAERLVREAQAAARIRHPNVVDIYDVGRDDQLVFLVMEYLEGEPLSAALSRRDLPTHKLIALLLPAMRGVAEAHRQGVVHRDIKPENIFLARQLDAPEPNAKVLDFGISKLLDTRGRSLRALTADGYAIGTPYYMAYEQALGEKSIDGRVDVYAFGAILYEALTGQVPRTAEDFSSLARQFISQRVAPPIELRAQTPPALSALVMWAIERDRELRVASMESLIRELDPFASERAYRVDDSSKNAPAKPIGGRTLVGPWGMGAPKPVAPKRLVQTEPARSESADATTRDVVLWLKRKRSRYVRGASLLLGLLVLALGLVVFSLVPRAGQTSKPAPHIVSIRQAATAEKLVEPTTVSASGLSALPEQQPPNIQETTQAEPSAPVAQPKKMPAASAPAASLPLPAVQPKPAAPKPASPPRKPTTKERDFGIY